MREEMSDRFAQTNDEFTKVRAEMGNGFTEIRNEVANKIEDVRTEMHDGFTEIKRMPLEAQIKYLESDNIILRKLDELQETVRYAVDTTHENREEIRRLKNRLS
jgi:hypothetical protein